MRVWSIHPKYLDVKGLVALWRETLLSKNVLEGKTKGYRNHPQLNRFKGAKNPVSAINQYLSDIYAEATSRGYQFNRDKIHWEFEPIEMTVTSGQLAYEKSHLLNKLKIRDLERYHQLEHLNLETHPMFKVIEGDIEDWEIV